MFGSPILGFSDFLDHLLMLGSPIWGFSDFLELGPMLGEPVPTAGGTGPRRRGNRSAGKLERIPYYRK